MAETKTGMQQEETKSAQDMLGGLNWGDSKPQHEDKSEIAIHFATGHMKEFTGQDGKEYARISIPTEQEQGKSWPSFVLPRDMVKENEGGKSMWAKIPAEGKTTLSVSEATGVGEDGKKLFKTKYASIENKDLKKLMEASREQSQNRDSFKDKLEEKKAEVQPPAQGMGAQHKDQVL